MTKYDDKKVDLNKVVFTFSLPIENYYDGTRKSENFINKYEDLEEKMSKDFNGANYQNIKYASTGIEFWCITNLKTKKEKIFVDEVEEYNVLKLNDLTSSVYYNTRTQVITENWDKLSDKPFYAIGDEWCVPEYEAFKFSELDLNKFILTEQRKIELQKELNLLKSQGKVVIKDLIKFATNVKDMI